MNLEVINALKELRERNQQEEIEENNYRESPDIGQRVPMEELRNIINDKDIWLRRFLIESHNGQSYSAGEFYQVSKEGEILPDREILYNLRISHYQNGGFKIYSCIELTGDLPLMNLNTVHNSMRPFYHRILFFRPDWYNLNMYHYME